MFDIFAVQLTGLTGCVLFVLAWVGITEIIADTITWFRDRFEWDRPSWRPWTWRPYRHWFAPGRLIEHEEFPLGRVLMVHFGPTGARGDALDTWLYVQPYRDDYHARPCWVPLVDVIPAPVGPFADDLALTDHDRTG